MKYILVLIIPLLFSFSDLKIGGTIYLDSEVLLKNPENLKLAISILENKKIVAVSNIKMAKFPQAFVVTQRHVIDPKTNFNGSYDIFVELIDLDANKTYQRIDKAFVGKQDLKILIGK